MKSKAINGYLYRSLIAFALAFFINISLTNAQEKTKIRISYPTASICCIALFASQQWKLFEENGLELKAFRCVPRRLTRLW